MDYVLKAAKEAIEQREVLIASHKNQIANQRRRAETEAKAIAKAQRNIEQAEQEIARLEKLNPELQAEIDGLKKFVQRKERQ